MDRSLKSMVSDLRRLADAAPGSTRSGPRAALIKAATVLEDSGASTLDDLLADWQNATARAKSASRATSKLRSVTKKTGSGPNQAVVDAALAEFRTLATAPVTAQLALVDDFARRKSLRKPEARAVVEAVAGSVSGLSSKADYWGRLKTHLTDRARYR